MSEIIEPSEMPETSETQKTPEPINDPTVKDTLTEGKISEVEYSPIEEKDVEAVEPSRTEKPEDMTDYQWAMRPDQTFAENQESIDLLKNEFSEREPGAELTHDEFIREKNKLDAINSGIREDVVNDRECFNPNTGELVWPDNGGFEGATEKVTLREGVELVRFGTPDGAYFAPEGTPYEEMSLPYDKEKVQETHWEVTTDFEVEMGKTAPAFHQEGGGYQYRLNSDETRISDYNTEHNAYDAGYDFTDSPSNLSYEGYLKRTDIPEIADVEIPEEYGVENESVNPDEVDDET